MASQHSTAIPAGSLILITGITSYVASFTAQSLLERGYRVKGVLRNLAQDSAWLIEELFPQFAAETGTGTFDLVEIPDLAAPHAFDEVFQQSRPSAVIHTATPMTFDPDPNKVITPVVDIMSSLLRAAARAAQQCAKVRLHVLHRRRLLAPTVLTRDSWNEAAVEAAWAPPPYQPERGGKVYAASKVEAERAMFRFAADDTQPGFTVASIDPFFVLGPVLHRRHLQGSGGWIRNVYNGEPKVSGVMPFGCQVNVQDVAALHVAAVLDPDVRSGDRLLAAAEPFDVNVVLALLRRHHPDRQFMEDLPSSQGQLCLATIGEEDNERLLGLLKKWTGREGWISLEQGVREAILSVKGL
ncbi:hypothetical protein PG984_016651 [Apiospora sp. TS-2023a]